MPKFLVDAVQRGEAPWQHCDGEEDEDGGDPGEAVRTEVDPHTGRASWPGYL